MATDQAPHYLSPSSISTLTNCSEQFRLERIVKAPQREGWGSVGGTVVHHITESLDLQRYEATGT